MNYRLVARYLGVFTLAFIPLIAPAALCAVVYAEWMALAAFVETMLVAALLGGVLMALGREAPDRMFQREALALVGLGWFLIAGVGALPYVFSGTLYGVDAYFESMSGFTTTGATVLPDIEAAPKSILFWRSFSQWLGGMGIIILFIAVLPYLGAGGKQLFKSEQSGPDPRGLSPRIKDTAAMLYKIYLGFTAALFVLLVWAGLDVYDALCHTFSTVSTGGFSPYAASAAHYDSVLVESLTIVFMILGGTSFALFIMFFLGDWRALIRSTEWRLYIGVLAAATLLIAVNLMGVQGRVAGDPRPAAETYEAGQALRAASFQVVSIMTSTGFVTDDFDAWPYFSRVLLVMLMVMGGCAGSTSGGFKVVRFIILAKMAHWRIEKTFRPKTIHAVRVDHQVVDGNVQRTIYAFFTLYIVLVGFGTLFMSLMGLPFESALTSVISTLSNIGPGLELIGAVEDFTVINAPGKLFLCLTMAMGRLELLSIYVMLLPSFWRPS